MKSPNPGVKLRQRPPPQTKSTNWMDWAKLIAPIAASVVLGVSGLIIQSRVSQAALNKDYVATALTILKEKPSEKPNEQDAALRIWALRVFAEHSPVPLPGAAKKSLYDGPTVFIPGLPFLPPPELCMQAPMGKSLQPEYEELLQQIKKAGGAKAATQLLVDFADRAVSLNQESERDRKKQQCLINWMHFLERTDIDYRLKLGMESSKDFLERVDREDAAKEAAATAASSASAPTRK